MCQGSPETVVGFADSSALALYEGLARGMVVEPFAKGGPWSLSTRSLRLLRREGDSKTTFVWHGQLVEQV